MTGLRQYLLTILCCCGICCILPLFADGVGKKLLRLICGVFLTGMIVGPIARVDVQSLLSGMLPEVSAADTSGETMARNAMAAIIKQKCEAYILDKAEALGLHLSVTVLLGSGDLPVPEGIRISGEAAPDKRLQLSAMLTEDMGIPEEAQQWIG